MSRRVVFVSATGNVSGAEVVLLNLIAEAARRGLRVRCVCPEGELPSRLPDVIEHVEIPEQGLGRGPKPMAALGWVAAARRAGQVLALCCADADAVIVNGFLALPAIRYARVSAPVSWVVHDVLRKADWFAVLRIVRSCITRAIPVSYAAAAPLRARGIPVKVVPNGVRWPVEPRLEAPPTPVIGCVALLTPWKGHMCLLDAFAQVRTPGARLELAGAVFPKDAGYAEDLRRRAEKPDLAGKVTFLGRVDTLPTMRGWTLAVSPSIEPEAMPLVVLEALSVGLPVIASAIGGSLEILSHAGGWLVPPADAPSLASAIDLLLGDEAEQLRLSQWGRTQVQEHYQLDVQVARQLDAVAGGPW